MLQWPHGITLDASDTPSRPSCITARRMVAPIAQLNSTTTGRGNSGAKTEPEERRLHWWYCDAPSRIAATPALNASGQGSGHSTRATTKSDGSAKIRRIMRLSWPT